MRLDDFMQFVWSTFGCGRTAVIQLTLDNYHVMYGCAMCEQAIRFDLKQARRGFFQIDESSNVSGQSVFLYRF
jgi:hypothetical protein